MIAVPGRYRGMAHPAVLLTAFCLLVTAGCSGTTRLLSGAPAADGLQYELAALPVTEYWSGVELDDHPMGYGQFRLTPAEDGFLLESSTELRFRMLEADKRSHYVTRDWVDDALQLQRFTHEYEMDDSTLRVQGHVADGKLHATITNAAGTHRQSLSLTTPVYPAAAQLLYPLLTGIREGARYQYQVYDGESQRLNVVEQEVTAYESVNGVPAWRMETIMNSNRSLSWLDARGLPIYEQAANGSIEAHLVSHADALAYLEDAARNRSETLLNYSLVHTGQVIGNPRQLRRMVIELSGLGDFVPPTDAGRQQCRQRDMQAYVCSIDTAGYGTFLDTGLHGSLATNPVVPADHERIQQLARRIAGDIGDPTQRISALIDWIRANIKGEAMDSFSALDVLEKGRGECQGQSFLYTALARALGIPTRVVNGLVYAREHSGFLYHTWAESWDGNVWRSVDPTFGQVPADATHVALLYGENLADFAPLMTLMGQLRASILEADPG